MITTNKKSKLREEKSRYQISLSVMLSLSLLFFNSLLAGLLYNVLHNVGGDPIPSHPIDNQSRRRIKTKQNKSRNKINDYLIP
jgi:hypothetical protein